MGGVYVGEVRSCGVDGIQLCGGGRKAVGATAETDR